MPQCQALVDAIKSNSVEEVERVLDSNDFDLSCLQVYYDNDNTPLHTAVMYRPGNSSISPIRILENHRGMLRTLFGKLVNVEGFSSKYLMSRVQSTFHKATVTTVISKNNDSFFSLSSETNTTSEDLGRTVLHQALMYFAPGIAKEEGLKAIHDDIALATVEILAQHNLLTYALIRAFDHNKKTVFHYAAEAGLTRTFAALLKLNFLEADVFVRQDSEGNTFWHTAIKNNAAAINDLIIRNENAVSVFYTNDIKDKEGCGILATAVSSLNVMVVDCVIDVLNSKSIPVLSKESIEYYLQVLSIKGKEAVAQSKDKDKAIQAFLDIFEKLAISGVARYSQDYIDNWPVIEQQQVRQLGPTLQEIFNEYISPKKGRINIPVPSFLASTDNSEENDVPNNPEANSFSSRVARFVTFCWDRNHPEQAEALVRNIEQKQSSNVPRPFFIVQEEGGVAQIQNFVEQDQEPQVQAEELRTCLLEEVKTLFFSDYKPEQSVFGFFKSVLSFNNGSGPNIHGSFLTRIAYGLYLAGAYINSINQCGVSSAIQNNNT